MSQTTLSVRMDSETKRGLEEFCAAVGMNTSTAVNLFAKAVIRERRIPFEIALPADDPFYSTSNMEHLRRSIEQANRGELITKSIEELEAMADE